MIFFLDEFCLIWQSWNLFCYVYNFWHPNSWFFQSLFTYTDQWGCLLVRRIAILRWFSKEENMRVSCTWDNLIPYACYGYNIKWTYMTWEGICQWNLYKFAYQANVFVRELFQWDLKYLVGFLGEFRETFLSLSSSCGTASPEEVHNELKPKLP